MCVTSDNWIDKPSRTTVFFKFWAQFHAGMDMINRGKESLYQHCTSTRLIDNTSNPTSAAGKVIPGFLFLVVRINNNHYNQYNPIQLKQKQSILSSKHNSAAHLNLLLRNFRHQLGLYHNRFRPWALPQNLKVAKLRDIKHLSKFLIIYRF